MINFTEPHFSESHVNDANSTVLPNRDFQTYDDRNEVNEISVSLQNHWVLYNVYNGLGWFPVLSSDLNVGRYIILRKDNKVKRV